MLWGPDVGLSSEFSSYSPRRGGGVAGAPALPSPAPSLPDKLRRTGRILRPGPGRLQTAPPPEPGGISWRPRHVSFPRAEGKFLP